VAAKQNDCAWQDYERAIWLLQRKRKRLLYGHPWRFGAIAAAALIVNAITFLSSKVPIPADLPFTCTATDILLVLCCALTLFEGQRSTKWFRNYAGSVRRLLRALE
jgi:hypothetical protein